DPSLRRFEADCLNMQYVIAAASDKPGMVHFHDSPDPYGGVASHNPFSEHGIQVPATTIDAEVEKHLLGGPFLLKLDTHGFEVPILEGAVETLKQTSLLAIEVYNFKLTDTCLKFYEMCSYLEKRGFSCLDICDVMRRWDNVFWQCDLFFAPSARRAFRSNSYDVAMD